ncbi:putative uncharacterized protein [Pseudomonas sp. StFLB209]|uniref:DUF4214 domain-containing protein n=1 Tax=Pseudomonas sp. StFLB209 TaxID=1028989 RepID=UPI0004F795C1|nr:DUF4214 domain-containing protein [Pseudomonas sp. StFLB209]BAP46038.1 putative uncharacterized protein [Pseudomonas sp. StFLB209]
MARVVYKRPFDGFDLDQALRAVAPEHVKSALGPAVDYELGAYSVNTTQVGGRLFRAEFAKDDELYLTVQNLTPDTSLSSAASLFSGSDSFEGSDGNDHFYASAGNDLYRGNGGIDTVHYSGSKNDYTLNGGNLTGEGKTDFLNPDIERIHFEGDNSTLARDVGQWQNAGSAYRLYKAAFDRTPDTGGLKYWINDLDNGATLQQVAQGFIDSAEFKALTPGNDAGSIINSFYQHVLHRDADEGGFNYWADSMAAGMTASEVLVSFSESAENLANTNADLNGGLWLV